MPDSFSNTYAEPRQKLLSLASEADAKVESVLHPTERGAQGEELAIDVATFGVPDDYWGEALVAAVVLRDKNTDVSDLIAYVRERKGRCAVTKAH